MRKRGTGAKVASMQDLVQSNSGSSSAHADASSFSACRFPSGQLRAPLAKSGRTRKPAAAQASKSRHGVGVIAGVDASLGAVSLDHEDIPGLISAMEARYEARWGLNRAHHRKSCGADQRPKARTYLYG